MLNLNQHKGIPPQNKHINPSGNSAGSFLYPALCPAGLCFSLSLPRKIIAPHYVHVLHLNRMKKAIVAIFLRRTVVTGSFPVFGPSQPYGAFGIAIMVFLASVAHFAVSSSVAFLNRITKHGLNNLLNRSGNSRLLV
jgi:hypothetical protein